MIGTVARRPRSSAAVLAATVAGMASAALLAGCASGGGGSTAASSSTSASSSSAAASSSGSVSGSKLTKGLLPADAFGTQATVIGLTLEQLRQSTSTLAAGAAAGIQVDPPSCAAAVQGTSPNYDKVDDLTAQSAVGSTGATVEALMTGGPAKGAAEKLRGAAAACPQATLTTPQSGQATITFSTLQIKDMGDDAAALQMTTTLTKPDGTKATVPALIAAVEDADRLLLLITAGTNGTTPDPAAFTALLEKAYSTEHAALK